MTSVFMLIFDTFHFYSKCSCDVIAVCTLSIQMQYIMHVMAVSKLISFVCYSDFTYLVTALGSDVRPWRLGLGLGL